MKLLWVCLKMPKCSFPDMGIRNGFVQHVWNIHNEKMCELFPEWAKSSTSFVGYWSKIHLDLHALFQHSNHQRRVLLDLLLETWLHSEKGGLPDHNRPPRPPSRNVPSPQQWQIWMCFFFVFTYFLNHHFSAVSTPSAFIDPWECPLGSGSCLTKDRMKLMVCWFTKRAGWKSVGSSWDIWSPPTIPKRKKSGRFGRRASSSSLSCFLPFTSWSS